MLGVYRWTGEEQHLCMREGHVVGSAHKEEALLCRAAACCDPLSKGVPPPNATPKQPTCLSCSCLASSRFSSYEICSVTVTICSSDAQTTCSHRSQAMHDMTRRAVW